MCGIRVKKSLWMNLQNVTDLDVKLANGWEREKNLDMSASGS